MANRLSVAHFAQSVFNAKITIVWRPAKTSQIEQIIPNEEDELLYRHGLCCITYVVIRSSEIGMRSDTVMEIKDSGPPLHFM
jgi:hypothetical protein